MKLDQKKQRFVQLELFTVEPSRKKLAWWLDLRRDATILNAHQT